MASDHSMFESVRRHMCLAFKSVFRSSVLTFPGVIQLCRSACRKMSFLVADKVC